MAVDYRLQARGIAKGLEAELTLVIDGIIPISIVTETLTAFHAAFPSGQLRVMSGWQDVAVRDLLGERADLGIFVRFFRCRHNSIRTCLERWTWWPSRLRSIHLHVATA